MNIYLDIDGTLLTKNFQPASNLHEFIERSLGLGRVYWLTTHCKEHNAQRVLEYLARFVDKSTLSLMSAIHPTHWDTLKTEAIDFKQDFLWFDDYILEIEKKILEKNGVIDSWIKVNLEKNSMLDLKSLTTDSL